MVKSLDGKTSTESYFAMGGFGIVFLMEYYFAYHSVFLLVQHVRAVDIDPQVKCVRNDCVSGDVDDELVWCRIQVVKLLLQGEGHKCKSYLILIFSPRYSRK